MNIFPAGEVLENVTTRGIQLDFRLGKKVEKHPYRDYRKKKRKKSAFPLNPAETCAIIYDTFSMHLNPLPEGVP